MGGGERVKQRWKEGKKKCKWEGKKGHGRVLRWVHSVLILAIHFYFSRCLVGVSKGCDLLWFFLFSPAEEGAKARRGWIPCLGHGCSSGWPWIQQSANAPWSWNAINFPWHNVPNRAYLGRLRFVILGYPEPICANWSCDTSSPHQIIILHLGNQHIWDFWPENVCLHDISLNEEGEHLILPA